MLASELAVEVKLGGIEVMSMTGRRHRNRVRGRSRGLSLVERFLSAESVIVKSRTAWHFFPSDFLLYEVARSDFGRVRI